LVRSQRRQREEAAFSAADDVACVVGNPIHALTTNVRAADPTQPEAMDADADVVQIINY
jgi:hypothetical protein